MMRNWQTQETHSHGNICCGHLGISYSRKTQTGRYVLLTEWELKTPYALDYYCCEAFPAQPEHDSSLLLPYSHPANKRGKQKNTFRSILAWTIWPNGLSEAQLILLLGNFLQHSNFNTERNGLSNARQNIFSKHS